MLLFALILLIGSSPIYGQTDDCPTVTGTPSSQTFCFLATVEDIASDGNAVYQTANNTTDTQPIPESELLANGNYFAGSTSGDCARIEITVTVNNAPRPSNTITNSVVSGFEFTTCTPASFNSANLAELFVAQPNYRIEVYDSEKSTTPIVGDTLSTGDSYFVGQVPTADAAPGSCPSFRVAVGFNPNQIEAPIAETPQIFCENATVADLVAEGTYDDTQAIRWYRSQTANSPLPDNTQLINGQSYFAAQVVNERGSPLPPCETPTGDRAPVRVELTEPIVINTPEPGEVCETDVDATFPSEDAIRNFYLGLLESGVPRDGTFSPDAGQIAQMYQNDSDGLGDFTTTYTVGEGSCQSSVDLTVTVVGVQDANAGTIENIEVPCGSTEIIVLDNSRLSQDATRDGTFTGTGVNAEGNFDPAVGPGTYTITYSVGDGSTCTTPGTSDTTTFDIIVGTEAFDFGTPETGIVCEDNVDATFPSFDEIRKYYLGLLEAGTPRNGTFDPTPRELSAMYQNNTNKVGDYTTTYTLGNGDCQSSVILTVSVVPNQDAEAGIIEDITVPCGSTDVVVLDDSILSDDATKGGTFSGTGINADGNFDPAVGPGSYEITYSVDDSANCVTPGTSDAITFTITVQGTDLGAPIALERCITEIRGFQTNPAAAIALFNDALAERGITDLTGTFTPSLQIVGGQILAFIQNPTDTATFVTTYSITSACGDSSLPISLTINNTTSANAGSIEDAIACTGQSTLNLFSLLDSNNPNGGTFTSGNGSITDGILDVTNTGTFNITYTVSESDLESCLSGSNSTDFTVTVSEGTTLPSPEPAIVCAGNVDALFPSFDEIRKFYLNLLPSGTPRNGTFNPTPREISEMYQNDADGLGDFTTTYTFANGSCDQIDLTVTVVDSRDAIAGTIQDATACTAQGTLDLFSLLTDSNISGGTFSNDNGVIANGVFDVSVIGDFNITYTVAESDSTTCLNGTDSTEFNVSVTESTVANAGDDSTITFCSNEESVNLADYLDGNTMPVGVFTGFEDGMFNPADNLGTTTITYTVDYSTDDDVCTTGTDTATFTVTVNEPQDADAGDDITASYCEDQTDLVDLRSLLSETNRNRGSFSTPYEDGMFNPSEAGLGEAIITYTINGAEDCAIGTDEATITITVNELQDANAGTIEDATACTAQGTLDLFSLLTDSNISGGIFSNDTGVIANGVLDISNEGDFNITYTVSESDASTCLNGIDSTDFTVSVSEGDANAGADNSTVVCMAEVDNFSTAQVRSLYLSLLEADVDRNGTFNPTINQIIAQYQINKIGDYTTVYSVEDGTCTDSASLTITVNESTAANAGDDVNLTFCSTEDSINLADFLSDAAAMNGAFEGFEDGTFNPANNAGTTTFTYTVDNSIDEDVCTTGTDTATFTITVNELQDANAGGLVEVTYCIGQDEDIDLTTILGSDALLTGSFSTPYENGFFNPSEAGVGEFEIIYTVDGAADCAIGTETATITITVNDVPAAPTAEANQSFCLIDNPTVADIDATGDNVIIYADEALTEEAIATTPLANNAVYYAVATGDNVCNSEAVTITITLTDGTAPTLQMEGDEFCRSDNPTIQDLVNNLSGSGIQIYQASTGGTALATSTALVDGATYFASGTDAGGCESSERLGVQVEVAFCGIPEAFSPNGDNINDRFVIPDIAIDFPNYTIEIFNRWGNVVFKGNASTGDWDGVSNQSGTLGDNVLPAGVYFYILNYNDGQTATIQGKVYLSR
ncbi:gliding motility-associated C-terminal domain-containing protein [Gillisia limnaea]